MVLQHLQTRIICGCCEKVARSTRCSHSNFIFANTYKTHEILILLWSKSRFPYKNLWKINILTPKANIFTSYIIPQNTIPYIGTEFLIFPCFATKMLFLFCKSMIMVRLCSILPLHSCAGIKTRFKALLKTQYLTLRPNF